MSIEDQKIEQISLKINELIALKNRLKADSERLLEENKSLKLEVEKKEKQYSELEREVEELKTIERVVSPTKNKLDEAKINGMIREIEECMTLLKS
jgi:regulator of replication initiation timing